MPRKLTPIELAARLSRAAARKAAKRSKSATQRLGLSRSVQRTKSNLASAKAFKRESKRQAVLGAISSEQANQIFSVFTEVRSPLAKRKLAAISQTPCEVYGLVFDEDGNVSGYAAPSIAAIRFAPKLGKVVYRSFEVCFDSDAIRWIAYLVNEKGDVVGHIPYQMSKDDARTNIEDLASIQKYVVDSKSVSVVIVPLRARPA